MWTRPLAQLLTIAVATLSVAGPAAAEAEPSPPAPYKPPSSKTADVRDNPQAYYVPGAWREKARSFLDPGPKGLAGGFILVDVDLGYDMKATYEATGQRIVVRVVPSRVAGPDARWTGQRVALRVEAAGEGTDAALADLERLLAKRETGWGWLRRNPDAAKKRAAAADALAAVREARRLIWIGERDAGVKAVLSALAEASGDVPSHVAGARLLHRAGRMSLAKGRAAAVVATARRGLTSKGLDDTLLVRTRLHVARTLAMAEEIDEALALGLEVAKGAQGCEAVGLARDLIVVNATPAAITLSDAIAQSAPDCDAAQALRVDLLTAIGKEAEAMAMARDLISTRTGLAATRSAWARAAMEAGALEEATLQASVPVERGGATGDSVVTLAAVMAAGGEAHAPMPKWLNMLERDATAANRGLGAATFATQGEEGKAVTQLLALEAAVPDGVELKAMRAVLLVRAGQLEAARAALEAAWDDEVLGLWAVAGEAELAEAEERKEDAIRAWEAYLTVRPPALGPLTRVQVQERLAALGSKAPVVEAKRKTTRPTEASEGGTKPATSEKDRIPTWVWLVFTMVGIVGLYLWRRTRSQGGP